MEGTQILSEASLKSQAIIWDGLFGFVDSMALKSAVELRIADIIHSHDCPITLSQLAASLESPASPDIPYLFRIMRSLVRKKIFSVHRPSDGGEALYGLTEASMWLLHDSRFSLAPMVIMENHPWQLAPWHFLSACAREGGIAFEKAHGCEIWDFASKNGAFNKIFNDGLACAVKFIMEALLREYKDGFTNIETLVDVGGGTGGAVAEIVKAHPHIKGINFDLPHVIATADQRPGVTHVGGDMFQSVPAADAILLKWVLHDWSDEHCIKILEKSKEAVKEKKGKIIIVEIVLEEENESGVLENTRMAFDLLMMAHTTGGKERSEAEWGKLLKEAGFVRYNIIKIPAIPSIIEAFPF
ncbi:(R,S)-reticuline 7-O-methyltransferase-like [Prosopis cineraria]|uniref:(R,S)-reticuline 7-O-methyltransferase-like n=1 Tax=Prosopis cineraria TaxID=364024 RepID=UPI0024109F67|nr:(R,S)-reticuline 7-O-methyltransferase-like [Prosopis cineraria]XP_054790298.1 (R,S)-reticuline 7-O-methyltransferase-like [Prosopis cineraria]XP_054812649.1 (R,S)-reticuline 7-O-methyltransferase-like [Prosopis cineraria]XP_054812650.1 (R,S)-reticuline 7-O-methyltransferase-like [Prosopis cineraria]